jgi:hypothetical protein
MKRTRFAGAPSCAPSHPCAGPRRWRGRHRSRRPTATPSAADRASSAAQQPGSTRRTSYLREGEVRRTCCLLVLLSISRRGNGMTARNSDAARG